MWYFETVANHSLATPSASETLRKTLTSAASSTKKCESYYISCAGLQEIQPKEVEQRQPRSGGPARRSGCVALGLQLQLRIAQFLP